VGDVGPEISTIDASLRGLLDPAFVVTSNKSAKNC
jgi:hypothetical protein